MSYEISTNKINSVLNVHYHLDYCGISYNLWPTHPSPTPIYNFANKGKLK